MVFIYSSDKLVSFQAILQQLFVLLSTIVTRPVRIRKTLTRTTLPPCSALATMDAYDTFLYASSMIFEKDLSRFVIIESLLVCL